MTGFRHVRRLHAYSGGTVRDLHPIPCSLRSREGTGVLDRFTCTRSEYHIPAPLSIENIHSEERRQAFAAVVFHAAFFRQLPDEDTVG